MDIGQMLAGDETPNFQGLLDVSTAVTGDQPTEIKDPSHTLPTEPLTPVEKAKLLDPTATFTYNNGEIDRTVQMEDIFNKINEKGSINLEEATEASTRFEGFKEALPLNGFTIMPSKVWHKEAVDLMRPQLDGRLEVQNKEFSDFIANPFVGAINSFREFKDGEGQLVTERLQEFCDKLRTLAFKGKNETFSKVRYLFSHESADDTGVDVVPMSTNLLEFKALDVKIPNELASAAFKNLQELASDHYVVNIVNHSNEGTKYNPALASDARVANVPITVITLLNLMAWGDIPDYIAFLKGQAETACSTLEELVPNLPATPVDFRAYRDFRVKYAESINYCTESLHYYPEILSKLRDIQMNLSVLCDFIPESQGT